MASPMCREIVASGRRAAAAAWGRTMSTASWWSHVEPAAKDPILGVTEAFLADPSPDKVNVGVGAYRDDNGKPVVLNCVREAERRIAGNLNMEYLPMGGSIKMIEEALKLAYGDDSELIKDKRIASVQALSGTGACRLFADFQRRFLPDSQIYIPLPTWANHHNIWRDAHVPQRTFHYYHPETKGLDFAAMMDDIKVKNHFPFFDMAYQGFATGDPERDAKAIRIFLEDGHMIGCAQSFAKNMAFTGREWDASGPCICGTRLAGGGLPLCHRPRDRRHPILPPPPSGEAFLLPRTGGRPAAAPGGRLLSLPGRAAKAFFDALDGRRFLPPV
ncbi:hypothetical protein KSP39_PZI024414 [Platanthera zijinensis]|uniref:Aminotransferase class I/classII large domain-containing protein n=1 Tax=Platanthera zijinensis TaxID=2320716 RepID=A0AAP0FU36_9ASPA